MSAKTETFRGPLTVLLPNLILMALRVCLTKRYAATCVLLTALTLTQRYPTPTTAICTISVKAVDKSTLQIISPALQEKCMTQQQVIVWLAKLVPHYVTRIITARIL